MKSNSTKKTTPNLKFRHIIIAIICCITTLPAFSQKKIVQVLAVNDMHAYIDRAAALGGIIDSLRAINPELFVVSGGDNRTGNPANDMYDEPSRPMTEIMNVFGVRASAIGNHEFDGKMAAFIKQVQRSNFPYLCANIKTSDTLGAKFDPYRIYDIGGVKLGLIGTIEVNLSRGIPDCHVDNCRGMIFHDPQIAIDKYCDIVRKQCDILALLTHNGYDQDQISAARHPEIDAIFGGHSHTLLQPNTFVNGVLVVQSGSRMMYCTLITFEVENGKVISKKSEVISVEATKCRNQKIADMVTEYNNNPKLLSVVCKLANPIKSYTNLGCLMADGQRYGSNAKIAIQNGGGVRYAYHAAGDFTVKDVLMLDPFGNEMIVYKLKGYEIAELISAFRKNDAGLEGYTSGISYEMTVDKNDTTKVLNISLKNEKGKPVRSKKTFKVAVNSYVASIIPLLKNKEGKPTGKISSDCIREFLEHEGTVDYSNVTRTVIIKK